MSDTAANTNQTIPGSTSSSSRGTVPVVAVRRRSRRRRKTTQPIDWRRLTLLLVTFAICLLIVVNRHMRGAVRGVIRQYLPSVFSAFSIEIVALLLCGLILIYLVPGVEDRVLQFVKVQLNARRHHLRRRRRR